MPISGTIYGYGQWLTDTQYKIPPKARTTEGYHSGSWTHKLSLKLVSVNSHLCLGYYVCILCFLHFRLELSWENCLKISCTGAPWLISWFRVQLQLRSWFRGFVGSSIASGSLLSACQHWAPVGSSVPLSLLLPHPHSQKINKTLRKMSCTRMYF